MLYYNVTCYNSIMLYVIYRNSIILYVICLLPPHSCSSDCLTFGQPKFLHSQKSPLITFGD